MEVLPREMLYYALEEKPVGLKWAKELRQAKRVREVSGDNVEAAAVCIAFRTLFSPY